MTIAQPPTLPSEDLSARLNRLYRYMEGEHALSPHFEPCVHDPWHVNLASPGSGWWNTRRSFRCGLLRVTAEVDGSWEYRVPGPTVLAIRDWLLEREALPNLYVCGSQSPLSPKMPYHNSDIDLLFVVPLEDLFRRAKHWHQVLLRVQRELMPACCEAFGQDVNCGLLASEFLAFPGMFDTAELTSPDALDLWSLELADVVTQLEQKRSDFETQAEQREALIRQVTALMTTPYMRPVQVVGEARWVDVTWLTASRHLE